MDELILLWNVHVADTVTKPHGFGVGGECGERIKGEDMGYYGHSKGNAIVIEIAMAVTTQCAYFLPESALCGFG